MLGEVGKSATARNPLAALRRDRGPPPLAAAAAPWTAAILMLALTLFSAGVLNDGDSFSHVAAGAWMLAHHAVLYTDPFSFTRDGAPWLAHEWGAEILMAAAFQIDGWTGVVVLTALAGALALYQMGRHLGRWLPAGLNLVLLVIAGSCISPYLLARPHILALPALEAWVAGLVIARSQDRAPSWLLLPVMGLWANLHGGFIIGLAMIGPLALEALLAAPRAWRRVVIGWGGFGIAATAAALLTPHGLSGLLFPFQLNAIPEISTIGEWQPTDLTVMQPLELLLLTILYLVISRRLRIGVVRLLVAAGLVAMTIQHTRHQLLAGVIVPLLIAQPLGVALAAQLHPQGGRPWRNAGLTAMAALIALRLLLPIVRTDSAAAPITALAHVPPALAAEPVFNDYGFGGFLISAHVRPFIDGRAELYGSPFLRQYLDMVKPDSTVLPKVLAEYGIRWTILAPENAAVAIMDKLPGWCRLYADKYAVIHVHPCP